MYGIDLNTPILYKEASFRYFDPDEHHVNRIYDNDVLLLVFEGTLCFEEDDTAYRIGAGHYHIQKANSVQTGKTASEMPKYLYVHFQGSWADTSQTLPKSGSFNIHALMPLLEKLDALSHSHSTYIEACGVFYQILAELYKTDKEETLAEQVANYLQKYYRRTISLDFLASYFQFSPNHIISCFKKEFGVTPFSYIQNLKMHEAENLLQNTTKSLQSIAMSLGYNDYAHFYKTFFATHQMSPLQYRLSKKYA